MRLQVRPGNRFRCGGAIFLFKSVTTNGPKTTYSLNHFRKSRNRFSNVFFAIFALKSNFRKKRNSSFKKRNLAVFLATLLVNLTYYYFTAQLGGINSKLDFGSTEEPKKTGKNVIKTIVSVRQSSPSKPLVSSKLGTNPFNFHAISTAADDAADKIKKDFDGISLICVDGGCNTTKTEENDVKTDIVVEVKTNVKEKDNKDAKGDEKDADVPVVVGNAGTKEIGGRKYDSDGHILTTPTQPPIFVPYDVNRKDNGHELQVPHFDPTFNNHYFGENPPPVYVWYKTRTGGMNPQAFNPLPRWRTNRPLSDWQRSYVKQTTPGWTPSTVCTCTNPGLNWYPKNSGY